MTATVHAALVTGDHRVLHGLVDRRCAGSSPQRGSTQTVRPAVRGGWRVSS